MKIGKIIAGVLSGALLATSASANADGVAPSVSAKVMSNSEYAKAAASYQLRKGYQSRKGRSVIDRSDFLPLGGLLLIGGTSIGVATSVSPTKTSPASP